jgi:hypothetical protein
MTASVPRVSNPSRPNGITLPRVLPRLATPQEQQPRPAPHVPGGCTHHTEANVLAGNSWGWVPAFAPAGWLRISAASLVQATAGNTSRTATRRCTDCTRNIQD